MANFDGVDGIRTKTDMLLRARGIKMRPKIVLKNQWRNDRGAEGGSCPRAQQERGRKIGGTKVGFMQFVE